MSEEGKFKQTSGALVNERGEHIPANNMWDPAPPEITAAPRGPALPARVEQTLVLYITTYIHDGRRTQPMSTTPGRLCSRNRIDQVSSKM